MPAAVAEASSSPARPGCSLGIAGRRSAGPRVAERLRAGERPARGATAGPALHRRAGRRRRRGAVGRPERFAHAQEIVTHAAPGLQRILNEALARGRLVRRGARGPDRAGRGGRGPRRAASAPSARSWPRRRGSGCSSASPSASSWRASCAGHADDHRRRGDHEHGHPLPRPLRVRAGARGHDGADRPVPDRQPEGGRDADEVAADAILLTHGHADHIGDTVAIAQRTGARSSAIVELAGEIAGELGDGHDVRDPNLGGTVEFDWGWCALVPAWHTSTTPKGTVNTPAGMVVELGGKRIYHLGDTGAVQRPRAAAPPRPPRRRARSRSAATTRWIASTPSSPRSCRRAAGHPDATTTRSRRSRPTRRRSSADVERAGVAQVVVLEPGEAAGRSVITRRSS